MCSSGFQASHPKTCLLNKAVLDHTGVPICYTCVKTKVAGPRRAWVPVNFQSPFSSPALTTNWSGRIFVPFDRLTGRSVTNALWSACWWHMFRALALLTTPHACFVCLRWELHMAGMWQRLGTYQPEAKVPCHPMQPRDLASKLKHCFMNKVFSML